MWEHDVSFQNNWGFPITMGEPAQVSLPYKISHFGLEHLHICNSADISIVTFDTGLTGCLLCHFENLPEFYQISIDYGDNQLWSS